MKNPSRTRAFLAADNRILAQTVAELESKLAQAQQAIDEQHRAWDCENGARWDAEEALAQAQQEIARLHKQVEILRQALNGTGE